MNKAKSEAMKAAWQRPEYVARMAERNCGMWGSEMRRRNIIPPRMSAADWPTKKVKETRKP